MTQIKLTPRLRAAAEMVRDGSYVADIGSDHAYLPIVLCLEGRIRGGVASDINEGPVMRGRKNIEDHGLSGKLHSVRADGLEGIERFCPEDIFILGMGGELISAILERAPWTKNKNIRLCLQPMTHPEILRAFLRDNGYCVVDERAVAEDDRVYQLILAEYTGESEQYSTEELLLGKINLARRPSELAPLTDKYISMLDKRICGRAMAGEPANEDRELKQRLEEIRRSL